MTRFVSAFLATAMFAVVASVSHAGTIAIKVSKAETIEVGTEKQMVVELNRDGESRALNLRFEDLPKGVTVSAISIPSDQSKATVTLVVTKEAEVVSEKKVKIFVESEDKAISSSEVFSLTIKKH